jgi:hypothetical protein
MSKNLKNSIMDFAYKIELSKLFFSILAKHLVKMLTNRLWSLFGEQCNKKEPLNAMWEYRGLLES